MQKEVLNQRLKGPIGYILLSYFCTMLWISLISYIAWESALFRHLNNIIVYGKLLRREDTI